MRLSAPATTDELVARTLQCLPGMNLGTNTALLFTAKLDQVREIYQSDFRGMDLGRAGALAAIQQSPSVKREHLLALAAQGLLLAESIEVEAQAEHDARLVAVAEMEAELTARLGAQVG